MDVERRMALLERENDELREMVRRLQDELADTETLPFEWGLTAAERTIFGVLVNKVIAKKGTLMTALYGLANEEAEPKIVDVFVCKMRKKLRPFGIKIHTVWGTGYAVDAEYRERFRRQAVAA